MTTLTQKMEKTFRSLSNHIARGNRINQQRSYDLIDRYEALKERMKEEGLWDSWCLSHSFSTDHDAYDNFA